MLKYIRGLIMKKKDIEKALEDGLTIGEMSVRFEKGATTIRYWMKKFGLRPNFNGPKKIWSEQRRHGDENTPNDPTAIDNQDDKQQILHDKLE